MVNPEIINARLREMEENLALLDEIKSTSFERFQDEPKIFKLALYCLQVSIQCLLDICHHIIVDNDWPKPQNNTEAIEIITRHNILPEEFSKKIMSMAGLRNILVHEYIKIDLKRIFKYIQQIQDFRQFQKYILAYLRKHS